MKTHHKILFTRFFFLFLFNSFLLNNRLHGQQLRNVAILDGAGGPIYGLTITDILSLGSEGSIISYNYQQNAGGPAIPGIIRVNTAGAVIFNRAYDLPNGRFLVLKLRSSDTPFQENPAQPVFYAMFNYVQSGYDNKPVICKIDYNTGLPLHSVLFDGYYPYDAMLPIDFRVAIESNGTKYYRLLTMGRNNGSVNTPYLSKIYSLRYDGTNNTINTEEIYRNGSTNTVFEPRAILNASLAYSNPQPYHYYEIGGTYYDLTAAATKGMHFSKNWNTVLGKTLQFGTNSIERIVFGTVDGMTMVAGQDLSNKHFFISLLSNNSNGYDWVKTYRNFNFILQGTAFLYGASVSHSDFGLNKTLAGAVESTNPFMSGYVNLTFDQQNGNILETNRYDLWLWGYGSTSEHLTTHGDFPPSHVYGVAERRNVGFNDNKFYVWQGNVSTCRYPLSFTTTNQPFTANLDPSFTVQPVTGATATVVNVTSPAAINASVSNLCFDHGRGNPYERFSSIIPDSALPRYLNFPQPERIFSGRAFSINASKSITENPGNITTLTIAPNPATHQLTLQSTDMIQSVLITDLSGRILKTCNGQYNNQLVIDVSGLKAGIYIAKIFNAPNKVETKKFIVQ